MPTLPQPRTFSARFGWLGAFWVLMTSAIFVSYALDTHQLNQRSLQDTSLAQGLIDAVATGDQGEIHFKKQVQEWKNMLLRGHDPQSLQKHLAHYRQELKLTQTAWRQLAAATARLHLDAQLNQRIQQLLTTHRELDRRYMAALAQVPVEDPHWSGRIDALVQGIDRPLTTDMEQLTAAVRQETNRLLTQVEADARSQADDYNQRTLFFLIVDSVALGVVILVMFVLVASFRRKSARICASAGVIADGDMTARIPMAGGRSLDELDQVAQAFNTMAGNLVRMVLTVQVQADAVKLVNDHLLAVRSHLEENTQLSHQLAEEVLANNSTLHNETGVLSIKATESSEDVGHASASVETFAHDLEVIAGAAEMARGNVATVADDAERMSANIAEVNRNLDHVNQSAGDVSHAIQTLTRSLQEVRTRCEAARDQSLQVNQHAQETSRTMEKLSASARDIGQVVEVISGIADQINMLALNAAIEAAGAGEAGRGFAVVATEVKSLAHQAAEATDMIRDRIEEIQDNTRESAGMTEAVTAGMANITSANDEIALAVGRQSGAVEEIAHSMGQVTVAAQGVTRNAAVMGEAAQRVAQAALTAASSTREISAATTQAARAAQSVKESSSGTAFKTSQVSNSAGTVLEMASEIQKRILQLIHLATRSLGSARHTSQLVEVAASASSTLTQSVSGFKIGPAPFDAALLKDHYLRWIGSLEETICSRDHLPDDPQPSNAPLQQIETWLADTGMRLFGGLGAFANLQEAHRQLRAAGEAFQALCQECRHPNGAEEEDDLFFFGNEEPSQPTSPRHDHATLQAQAETKLLEVQQHLQAVFSLLDDIYLAMGRPG